MDFIQLESISGNRKSPTKICSNIREPFYVNVAVPYSDRAFQTSLLS